MNCKLPMATLHEVLSKSSPAIAEDAVTQFRSGLVFIINRLHDEVAEGIQLSLLDQTKRLDDEGYDSCKLLIILNHVTEATIGSSATQELLSFIQENVAEPDGLPLLLAHVHSSFPELARAIDELESQAIQEENQLLTVAGGMSKKAEIGTILGGVVGVLAVTGIVAFQKRRSMFAERAIREEQKEYDNIVDQSVREKEHLKLASEKVTKIEVDKAISDPEGVIRIKNSIQQYGLDDIEKHAELLTLQHISKFGVQFGEKLKLAFKDSVKSKELNLLLDPDFAPTLQKGLEKKTKQVFTFEGLEETIDQIESNEFDHSFELKAWNDLVQDLKKAPLWKQRIKLYKDNGALQDARDNVYSNMKSSYRYLVSQEVEEAKKMMDEDAMTELNGWIKDGEEMIKLSETKIQEHLQYYEQEIIGESQIDLQELEQSFDSFHED